MKAIDTTGVWWLPENPDDILSGKLRFELTDRPSLELVGSWTDVTEFQQPDQGRFPVVHGFAGGHTYTLLDAHTLGVTMSMPGAATSRLEGQLLVDGKHIAGESALSFATISVELAHLTEWVSQSCFRLEIQEDPVERHLRSWTSRFELRDEPTYRLPNATLCFRHHFTQAGHIKYQHNMRQQTAIEITPARPMAFQDFRSGFLYHLQNLVMLGLGHPTHVTSCTAILADDFSEGATQSGRLLTLSWQQSLHLRRSRKEGYFEPYEMTLPFSAIGDRFADAVTRWIERSDVLRPVYDLYFSTAYSPDLYIESRFLSLVQALETYHRRTRNRPMLADGESEQLRRAVREVVNLHVPVRATRDAIASKLGHITDQSLRMRLRELVAEMKHTMGALMPHPERFVNLVVDTRNYLTHYSPELADRRVDGARHLWVLQEQCRVLLALFLLRELGVAHEGLVAAARSRPFAALKINLGELYSTAQNV